jgi:hypothetical protein
MRRRGSIVIFKEQMQVSDLVEQNWVVDDTCSVDFVKLLYSIFLLKVETENGI